MTDIRKAMQDFVHQQYPKLSNAVASLEALGGTQIKLSSAVASLECLSGLYLFAPAMFQIRVFPAQGWLCRHVKLQTAESPNSRHFPSFKLVFAVSYYFHTSFKLASNSSFKLAVKGELHFPGREISKANTYSSRFPILAPGKMQFSLTASLKLKFETSMKMVGSCKKEFETWKLPRTRTLCCLGLGHGHTTLRPAPCNSSPLAFRNNVSPIMGRY